MANKKHDFNRKWNKREGSMKYSDAKRVGKKWNEVNRKHREGT